MQETRNYTYLKNYFELLAQSQLYVLQVSGQSNLSGFQLCLIQLLQTKSARKVMTCVANFFF